MNPDILISKILASPGDHSWSQVYSTVNLYIVVSAEKAGATDAGTQGKHLLEKIQREYFALDEKNLDTIKTAVQNAIEGTDPTYTISVLVCCIVQQVLYVIIGHDGVITIKRGPNIGVVAQGEKGQVHGFSGPLKNGDIILIQTGEFSRKIPLLKLKEMIGNDTLFEIGESLAPLVHSNASGTEAAIILQYHERDTLTLADPSPAEKPIEHTPQTHLHEEPDTSLSQPQGDIQTNTNKKNPISLAQIQTKVVHLIANIRNKKTLILIPIIIFLIGVFMVSIARDKQQKETSQRHVAYQEIEAQAQKKYTDGKALLSLNKGLAQENLLAAQDILKRRQKEFPEGTEERKKLDALLLTISNDLQGLEHDTMVKNQKVLFDSAISKDAEAIQSIALKGGTLAGYDAQSGTILLFDKESGVVSKKITAVKNGASITADDANVYLLAGASIHKADKKSGKVEEIIKDSPQSSVFDTFLGNLYVPNNTKGTIEKFSSPSYGKTLYIPEDSLTTNISSLTIDASIWILQQDLKVRKFTKGKEDSFQIRGLAKPFSQNSLIYTASGFTSIYILDKNNKSILVISKNGDYQSQIDLKSLEGLIQSFAIDEPTKKAYVSTSTKVYSFDL